MRLILCFVGLFLLLPSGRANSQDQAQENLRQQQQQELNWQWHQAELEASQQQQTAPPQPSPSGEWLKTWGAVADGSNGEGGVAAGQLSQALAENLAISQCREGGGVGCEVTSTYFNQCIAIASPKARAKAGSRAEAEGLAKEACSRSSDSCKIVYSACSEPIFRRYN